MSWAAPTIMAPQATTPMPITSEASNPRAVTSTPARQINPPVSILARAAAFSWSRPTEFASAKLYPQSQAWAVSGHTSPHNGQS
jgi:hypothetical protein